MSLQFADLNADGHKDIVTAVWEGTVFVVPGSANGFGQPEYVRDADGNLIVLSRYYDMPKKAYITLDKAKPTEHLVSALAFDWDHDGDLDLILGAKDGQIYLRRNDGKPGEAKFATTSTPLAAGGKPFVVPGGSTAPRAVDWDGDGLTDLVCGSFKGGAYLYRNTGKRGAPEFAAPLALASPAKGQDGEPIGPDNGWYVDPVDCDGDGKLDLLVGGYRMRQPKPKKLTDAERERLAEVERELEKLNAEFSKSYTELNAKLKTLSTEEQKKLRLEWAKKPENMAQSKQRSALFVERGSLRPIARRESGVWVYHQLDAATKPSDAPAEPARRRPNVL